MSIILGINFTYHELAAAVVKDGQLIAAMEEERLTRTKHGKPARIDNPDVLPINAINYCLREAGVKLHQVDYIGLSFYPDDRLKNIGLDSYFKENDWGSREGEKLFVRKIKNAPALLSQLAGSDLSAKIHWLPHHLCHAASSFFVSPYEEAAILSIDGIGEITSTWLGKGAGNKIGAIKEIQYPHSIGFLWEKFSKFLGFSEYDAAKVMGLAAYGDRAKFYPKFKELIAIIDDGGYRVNNDILRFRLDDFSALEGLFGTKKLNDAAAITQEHKDMAAALQAITDEVVLGLARYLRAKTKARNLCLTGGVVLNCVTNQKIMASGLFKGIYIQPAAHDAGTALGAAYYIWHQLLNREQKFIMRHAYWGPEFSEAETELILKNNKLSYKKSADMAAEAAKLLSEGNIVGWFQGKMEFGPRALGNRSLLSDPRDAKIKDILNSRIKHRESFRPFAPSVLAEDAGEWFDIPRDCQSLSSQFMEITFNVKPEKAGVIPAVVHVDKTSRAQIVFKQANPKYHPLLSEFKKITGVPMLLNTSFNENEPIVCTPADAVKTFLRTRMDYLAIGDFLVRRQV